MQEIKIDGKTLTIGLEWDALKRETSQSKEIKELVKNNPGVKHGILLKSTEDEIVIGMIPAGEKIKSPSGAAYLAAANKKENAINKKNDEPLKDWIVVEMVENDKFWLCVIKNGIPLPGFDFLDDWDGIYSRIVELLETSDFDLYVSETNFNTVFDETEYNVYQKGYKELTDKVKYKNNVRLLTGTDPRLLMVIGGVVLVGMGYFAYDYWQTSQQEQEAIERSNRESQQQNADSLKAQQRYEEQKKEVLKAAFKNAEDSLNGLLSQARPTQLINSWVSLLDSIKTSHNGWDISSVECGTGQVATCTISLKRGELGVNKTLVEDFPDAEINGDNANYSLKGNVFSVVVGNYKELPGVKEFKIDVSTDLQLMKYAEVKHAIDASTEITQEVKLPEPPKGFNQEMNIEPIKMGVAAGALHLEGVGLWQLKGVADVLKSKTITIQKITLSVADDFKTAAWKMEGIYYVKVGEPVLPTIPPSKRIGN